LTDAAPTTIYCEHALYKLREIGTRYLKQQDRLNAIRIYEKVFDYRRNLEGNIEEGDSHYKDFFQQLCDIMIRTYQEILGTFSKFITVEAYRKIMIELRGELC